MKMMKDYFDSLADGLAAAIARDPSHISPRKAYALEVSRLGQRLYSGEHRVAWCGVTAPFDLLNAMGITSCFTEFVGSILAATGVVENFLETAEQEGYASDTCAYHRSVMGAAMQGLMPVPDFLVGTNIPCAGGLAVMENLAKRFNRPFYVLNLPQGDTEADVAYLADQIREMAAFITEHTGIKLSAEDLKQAVALTNQAREMSAELYELAKQAPSPNHGKMLANFGIVMALMLGTEAGVDVVKTYRDVYARKVAEKKGSGKKENYRLMWIQNRIQFKHPLIELLEDEYGAVVVVDELNDITWDPIDPEDPYTGMAARAISIPFNGPVERRIRHLQHLAREYRIDGAINPCHWGCRQGTGARGLIAEGLKEVDVPVLNLEVDCVDPRTFAEGQLRTRIEAFVEMLESRKLF